MKKLLILCLLFVVLSCQPRQFPSQKQEKKPAQLIEQAKKKERLVKDWAAMAVFTLIINAIYQNIKRP